ncbi:thioredoxin family protein [Pontibacillus sp. HMF3514]|uniref:thioredoxin family protein n=1 Tax=Pontibacillus sp. HMF3514 TaxID=2692425 RepID=UPI0013200711|nr:thioredoxin family protein [Pontibacillus sp. HMF3514]QHE53507.1 thioredoxin family protein [Pontibacillus sp. HMF3514]
MNLKEWFEKGMAPQEYVSAMNKHQDNLVYVYKTFDLPDDQDFFKYLKDQNLSVLVITEDWCGDAMLNIPILLRICEAANINVRMLPRDEHPELMDQYLTNGSRSIPIFIFFNSDGEQKAVWGPRAPQLQELVDESRENLPSQDSPDFEEKQREMILFLTKAYRENNALWTEVYESLKRTLYK